MKEARVRQVIVRSPGVVDVVEAEVPTPGPGEVRVRSAVVGIPAHELVTATLALLDASQAFSLAAAGEQVTVHLIVGDR
jgi:NADPH:quinone reductase-like Zn-dependent oxidoreductase